MTREYFFENVYICIYTASIIKTKTENIRINRPSNNFQTVKYLKHLVYFKGSRATCKTKHTYTYAKH